MEWPHHMQITIAMTPSLEKIADRYVTYLEDSQSKAVQAQVDTLTAKLQPADQSLQDSNTKLAKIEKENT